MNTAADNLHLVDRLRLDVSKLTRSNRKIAERLIEQPVAFIHSSVQDIARQAEVSDATVVRFCRHYGYAGVPEFRIALAQALADPDMSANRLFVEPNLSDKTLVNTRQKRAIARYATRFLVTDRAILLDSGSTTEWFAHELRAAPALTVMTTGLNVVNALARSPQHTLMLPGGTVRVESMSIATRDIEIALAGMNFDTAYLAADAIDPDRGLSTFREDEARLNTAMAAAARRLIILADSSKFRAPALHNFHEIENIHAIVTDSGATDAIVQRIEARGTAVHRVEVKESL